MESFRITERLPDSDRATLMEGTRGCTICTAQVAWSQPLTIIQEAGYNNPTLVTFTGILYMEHSYTDKKIVYELRPSVLDEILVEYRAGKRIVTCFCGQEALRSIVPHLKHEHSDIWLTWVQHFVELRSTGFPLKKIMRLYRAGSGHLLFSWTVIERAIRDAVESGGIVFNPTLSEMVEHWEPTDFQLANGTVWDFPRRGTWAVHSSDYRGNWAPQVVRNLILKYTDPGDLLVDAFVGGGTTLIEAWLCGRRSVGVDISKLALQISQGKLAEMKLLATSDSRVSLPEKFLPTVIEGDSLELTNLLKKKGIHSNTVKLICAHPPYLDSIRFTNKNSKDLSFVKDPVEFHQKMCVFAQNAYELLEPGGICALLVGDVRKEGQFISLGIDTLRGFQEQEFTLESIVIKTQNHERSTEFYRNRNGNNLLLEHEYLFILRKGYP